jgi:hypothetical protein
MAPRFAWLAFVITSGAMKCGSPSAGGIARRHTVLWMTRPCSPAHSAWEIALAWPSVSFLLPRWRDVRHEMHGASGAVHFAAFMECMRVHCPGFPPKSCAALHCSVEAASCGMCIPSADAPWNVLTKSYKCVPDKYTTVLAAMDLSVPQEAVV